MVVCNRNVELIPGYVDRMRRECESEMIRCERVDVPAGFVPSYVRAESWRRHETHFVVVLNLTVALLRFCEAVLCLLVVVQLLFVFF